METYSQTIHHNNNGKMEWSNKHGLNTHSTCKSPRLVFLECHKHTLIKYLQAVKLCGKKGFNWRTHTRTEDSLKRPKVHVELHARAWDLSDPPDSEQNQALVFFSTFTSDLGHEVMRTGVPTDCSQRSRWWSLRNKLCSTDVTQSPSLPQKPWIKVPR